MTELLEKLVALIGDYIINSPRMLSKINSCIAESNTELDPEEVNNILSSYINDSTFFQERVSDIISNYDESTDRFDRKVMRVVEEMTFETTVRS